MEKVTATFIIGNETKGPIEIYETQADSVRSSGLFTEEGSDGEYTFTYLGPQQ